MAKKIKEQDGAVTDSMSSEMVVAVPKSEDCAETLEPGLVNFAKDLIIQYAKEYRRHPQCPAQVLLELIDDYHVECEANRSQKNMSDKEIVADARKLFDLAADLTEDYDKHHDQANDSIKSIMRVHVPTLQKAFDKYNELLLEAETTEPSKE